MGFFSKIFKGIKKVVKKIGKGIKSAFKKFGKFMGKIGILGKVAMFFIMPHVAGMFGNAFMGTAGALAGNTVGGALGAIGQAAGRVMEFVGNTVKTAGNAFNNITKGVTDTLGNFAKTAGKKLGLEGEMFTNAADTFFGEGDSAFGRSFGEESRFQNLTKDFSKAIDDTVRESSPNSKDFGSLSSDQIKTIKGASIEDFESIGFKTKGNVGDISYDFGDKQLFLDVDSLAKLNEAGLGEKFMPFQTGETVQKSLLSRVGDIGTAVVEGVKQIPENIVSRVEEFATDPVGQTFEGFEERYQDSAQTRLLQEIGIEEKPQYEQTNISNVAYVPSMDSFFASPIQTADIMNPRAFEQQVLNNPDPFGYTAFQYNQYMSSRVA